MERLVVNCRSYRRYLDKNLDPKIITRIIHAMIMSYSADVLEEFSPKARALPDISQDHLIKLIVGFCYPISEDFLKIRDEYLPEETARKVVTDIAALPPF